MVVGEKERKGTKREAEKEKKKETGNEVWRVAKRGEKVNSDKRRVIGE